MIFFLYNNLHVLVDNESICQFVFRFSLSKFPSSNSKPNLGIDLCIIHFSNWNFRKDSLKRNDAYIYICEHIQRQVYIYIYIYIKVYMSVYVFVVACICIWFLMFLLVNALWIFIRGLYMNINICTYLSVNINICTYLSVNINICTYSHGIENLTHNVWQSLSKKFSNPDIIYFVNTFTRNKI